MPIYMDRHYMANATRRAIALAHQKDLAIQDEYGVRFLTYWFDEDRNTTFCLVDAPDKESVNCVHSHAHGDIPHEIIEVDPALVDAFLGGIGERIPVHNDNIEDPDNAGPGLRYIMFTDLVDSTATTTRLGDRQAMHLLRIHNALTRNALRDHHGREVKHTGDGFMVSFAVLDSALSCAIDIQRAFAAHREEHPDDAMHLRIGLSAGEPVTEDGDLFGSAVQLAARLCSFAQSDDILVTDVIYSASPHGLYDINNAGNISPKGFEGEIPVYRLQWASS